MARDVNPRDRLAYLAIWKKAWEVRDTLPLEIPCETYSQALATRVGLYRAIRPYRDGELDPIFTKAAAELTVSPPKKGESTITIRKRYEAAEHLNGVLQSLGISPEELLSEEAKRLQDLVEKPERKENPFYG